MNFGFRFGKGVGTHLVLRALNNRAKRYAELDAMGPEARAEHDAAIVELREKLGFGTQAKTAVQVKLRDCRSSDLTPNGIRDLLLVQEACAKHVRPL